MRSRLLLMAMFVSTLLLFGFQILSPISKATPPLPATIDVKPETLNLKMKGKWISVHISLPGYNVTDIDQSTIRLEGLLSPEWSNIEDGKLVAKFCASGVIEYLWYHMEGNRVSVELTIACQLADGTQFLGTDRITIMDPSGY